MKGEQGLDDYITLFEQLTCLGVFTDYPARWSSGCYGPDSPICHRVVLPLEVNAPVMWCGFDYACHKVIINY